jgi:hypothetical protein
MLPETLILWILDHHGGKMDLKDLMFEFSLYWGKCGELATP